MTLYNLGSGGSLLSLEAQPSPPADQVAADPVESTSMLLSLIRKIHAFRKYWRNVAELSAMTDHDLHDIGLTRAEIPYVVAGKYNG